MEKDVGDIITLDNNNWLILTKFKYNNKEYYFTNVINLETEEFGQDYCLVDSNNNKITDVDLIEELFPYVKENLAREMKNNNINYTNESSDINE